MQNFRLVAGAVGAFVTALALAAPSASANILNINSPGLRASHISVQPYMRIPTGSRGEAAALKADQDAARLSVQRKKKGKKRR